MAEAITRAAVIGGGIIGASWALVLARAGLAVTIYERTPELAATLVQRIGDAAEASRQVAPEVSTAAIIARLKVVGEIEAALPGAGWVEECVSEDRDLKAEIFARLDRASDPGAILASATSGIPASRFTADLPGRARCLVAHPATPPHLLPVIEVVPAAFTAPETTDRAFAFLRRVGLSPVLIAREVDGFVMNRLQGALLVEMLRLIGEGVVSPDGADKIIGDGFGLRWAFMGPLEGVDLNAPGGIADYLGRYGGIFERLVVERGGKGPVVTPEIVARLEADMRPRLSLQKLAERRAARDRRIAALRALRRELGEGAGERQGGST
jgi:L-gulonate 3-dehydrogenase